MIQVHHFHGISKISTRTTEKRVEGTNLLVATELPSLATSTGSLVPNVDLDSSFKEGEPTEKDQEFCPRESLSPGPQVLDGSILDDQLIEEHFLPTDELEEDENRQLHDSQDEVDSNIDLDGNVEGDTDEILDTAERLDELEIERSENEPLARETDFEASQDSNDIKMDSQTHLSHHSIDSDTLERSFSSASDKASV